MATNSWDSRLSENRSMGLRDPERPPKVASGDVLAWRCGVKNIGERHLPWAGMTGLAYCVSSQVEPSMALRLDNSQVLNF